ncbi:ROK family transcriptional regulator [Actinacidiphila yeochonensis]|uniref:ROK family transcriptional regulator n=1 Tax=Actinacidiphila yeochonensis TaxID=89050 RepID=UPI0005610690|nr:ROK family transcriptional regulator [Actinacidiphila yeochonensis]
MTQTRGPRTTTPVLERAVLDAFRHRHDPLRRVDLMARTGLSRPVVTALLDNLVAQGLVAPVPDAAPSGRGRPSPAFRLTRAATCAALVRLHRGPTALTLVTAEGPTPRRTLDLPWAGRWDEWADAVAALLARAEDDHGLRARYAVVATPFPVNTAGDGPAFPEPPSTPGAHGPESPFARTLRAWRRENPREHLVRVLGRPVRLVNDANLAALGEARYGAAAGSASSLHLSVREGLGAGIVINGRLHQGALGTAGELAHVPVVENGPYCRCGRRGCLATQTPGPGLEAAFTRLYERPLASADADGILRAPDSAAARLLTDLGRLVARPLAGVVTMLNPEVLVIDPALHAGHRPFVDGLSTHLAPAAARAPRIVPGDLPDAHAYGALALGDREPAAPYPATAGGSAGG